jgi:hypothetical protein
MLGPLARRLSLVAVPVVLAASTLAGPHAASAYGHSPVGESHRVLTIHVRAAVKQLPVKAETPKGYDRDKYQLWIDADGDCQDTRDEVLAAESKTPVTGCDIRTGRWLSYYDRETWTNSSDVDIDHLVPLKEGWDSGAKKWNADTRTRYANDLRDSRTLVAVTDNVNQSKSDRDPAEWMPTYGKCRYLREWTAVKMRWGLTVDQAEKTKLTRLASNCPNPILTVTKAKIVKASPSTGGDNPTGGGGLDPRFDYCYQVKAAGYGPYSQGKDPEYAWYTDGDNDGIVCE